MATWQVTASADDCSRRLDTSFFSLTNAYASAGHVAGSSSQWGCGMRFMAITIPKGSTILEAYLTLRADASVSGANANTRISAEDVDDAVTFADDSAAFDTRWAARTTARMDWDGIASWTAGVDYDSPTTDGVTTFASIIQEVIDRASWVSGNDIVIFWDDFDNRSVAVANNYRRASSFNGSEANAPKLIITYTVPATRGWMSK